MKILRLANFFFHRWLFAANDEVLVGGQAVIEGVMMRSPQSYSIAVRRPDQTVAIKKEYLTKPSDRRKIWKLPVFRGVATLGQAMVLGIRALKFSTDMALEGLSEKDKAETPAQESRPSGDAGTWFITLNILLALVFFVVLFKLVPLYLANLLKEQVPFFGNWILFSLVDGIIRMVIFLGYIAAISLLKDIRRVFEYHGAEHKVVFTFEAGEDLKVENARKHSTLHPRCGTSFLLVVMLISILIYALIPFQSFLWKLLSRLALLPLIAGLSYEVIRYAAKRPTALLRFLTLPGLWLQRVTTREPSDEQLEIAVCALQEALSMENPEGKLAVL